MLYRLYRPEASVPRPLILFLHGVGESGNDNFSQMVGTVGAIRLAERYPDMYIMAPQAPARPKTADQTRGIPAEFCRGHHEHHLRLDPDLSVPNLRHHPQNDCRWAGGSSPGLCDWSLHGRWWGPVCHERWRGPVRCLGPCLPHHDPRVLRHSAGPDPWKTVDLCGLCGPHHLPSQVYCGWDSGTAGPGQSRRAPHPSTVRKSCKLTASPPIQTSPSRSCLRRTTTAGS